MFRFASLGTRRTMLLALVVVALTAAVSLGSSAPAAAVGCGNGLCPSINTIYFSGPDRLTIFGRCTCNDCTGKMTAYPKSVVGCCACE